MFASRIPRRLRSLGEGAASARMSLIRPGNLMNHRIGSPGSMFKLKQSRCPRSVPAIFSDAGGPARVPSCSAPCRGFYTR